MTLKYYALHQTSNLNSYSMYSKRGHNQFTTCMYFWSHVNHTMSTPGVCGIWHSYEQIQSSMVRETKTIYNFGKHVSIRTSYAAHSLPETLHCALFAICFVCKSVHNRSYSWYIYLGIRARYFPSGSGMIRSDLPTRYCWWLCPSRQPCVW